MVGAETAVGDPRARRRERARSDILELAWSLAERDGLASLSLRELARGAGMRAPSLYTYFESKGAIFDAMFVQGYEQLDELYASLPVDRSDPAQSLASATSEFVKFCQASIPRYQLLFTRVVPNWEPSVHAYAASVASYEPMASALEALGIKGRAELDLWVAVSAGLAAQQVANDPDGDRWARLSRDAADMFLRHIGRVR